MSMLTTREQGVELLRMLEAGEISDPAKQEEAKVALTELSKRLQGEEQKNQLAAQNQQRLADASTAVNLLAVNPVGNPMRDPRGSHSGQFISPNALGPPRADADWVLHNQARDRGIDINLGAGFDERLGQGLAHLKEPELKQQMLEAHYRKLLKEAGIDWPETVPVVYSEEQTGKLAYVRAITGDDPDFEQNQGKTRLTLVNPAGIDIGDFVEFLPVLPTVAAEVGASIIAGAALKSPQAALLASSSAAAVINGLSSPAKNFLLKKYYGVTDEQLKQFSDPNEALKEAMFAGGMEFGMGQLLELGRWARNKGGNRVLTEDDYAALVEELEVVRQRVARFQRATGEEISDPLMFVEAASKKLDTTSGQSIGSKSLGFFKRLPNKIKMQLANANDVTRFKINRGSKTMNNNAVGYDPDGTHHLGLDDTGLVTPMQDIYDTGRQLSKYMEDDFGLTEARHAKWRAGEDFNEALDDLANRVNAQQFTSVQDKVLGQYNLSVRNEELQWGHFKALLEPSANGKEYGIKLINKPGSPINRALKDIDEQATQNLSKSMGQEQVQLVEDMAAMRAGELDIMQMHRLRSNLVRRQRMMSRQADPSGWTKEDIRSIIDAIDETMFKSDWVRKGTTAHPGSGLAVPAVKREAIARYHLARESTKMLNETASKDLINDLISTSNVYDWNQGRRVYGRRKFDMMPAQIEQALFEPRVVRGLADVMEMSGYNPHLRAGFADHLEGIYKEMALNPDGSFQRAGYEKFINSYGDHMNEVFGPENASRIRTADDFGRAVLKANENATKIADAYKVAFGAGFNPETLATKGTIDAVMSAGDISVPQTRRFMNRIRQLDPQMHQSLKAEFAQWSHMQLSRGEIFLKDGNAIRNFIGKNHGKMRAVMGNQYVRDMITIQKVTDLVDASDMARNVAEPVQQAWLQVTRSVFGPLSRKQRFMTAANRIMRGRGAEKALNLMADPEALRKFVQLEKMSSKSLAFWATVDSLGLRGLMADAGLTGPTDLKEVAAKEESLRNLAQGGPR